MVTDPCRREHSLVHQAHHRRARHAEKVSRLAGRKLGRERSDVERQPRSDCLEDHDDSECELAVYLASRLADLQLETLAAGYGVARGSSERAGIGRWRVGPDDD